MADHIRPEGTITDYQAFAHWEIQTFGTGQPYHRTIQGNFDELNRMDDLLLYQQQYLSVYPGQQNYALRHLLFYRWKTELEEISSESVELMRLIQTGVPIFRRIEEQVCQETWLHPSMRGLVIPNDKPFQDWALPEMLHYFYIRKRILTAWEQEPETIRQSTDLLLGYDRITCLRNTMSEWADTLIFSMGKTLSGSRIHQILLQLRSLRILHEPTPENDWFYYESDHRLREYARNLLIELYMTALCWNGRSPIPPRLLTDTLPCGPRFLPHLVPLLNAAEGRILLLLKHFIPNDARSAIGFTNLGKLKHLQRQMIAEWLYAGALCANIPHDKVKHYSLCAMPMELPVPEEPEEYDSSSDEVFRMAIPSICKVISEETSKGSPYSNSVLDTMLRLLFSRNALGKEFANLLKEHIRCGDYLHGTHANQTALTAWDFGENTKDALFAWAEKQKFLACNPEKGDGRKNYDFYLIQAKENLERLKGTARKIPKSLIVDASQLYIQILLHPIEQTDRITADTYPQYWVNCIVPSEKTIFDLKSHYRGCDTEPLELLIRQTKESLESKRLAHARNKKQTTDRQTQPASWQNEKLLSQWATDHIKASKPEIWLPTVIRPDLGKRYFLGDLDSVAARVYGERLTEPEVRLMVHLMRGQHAVLSLPMLCDNRLLRTLAVLPDFKAILRSGRITVSSYGSIYSLTEYCAAQMENLSFTWSSLSAQFEKPLHRKNAAAYLRGQKRAASLSEEIRQEMEVFKAQIIALDENLPFQHRASVYQHPQRRTNQITYAGEMKAAYRHLKQNPDTFQSVIDLHNKIRLACTAALTEQDRRKTEYYRSDYRKMAGYFQAHISGEEGIPDVFQAVVARYAEQVRWTSEDMEQVLFLCDDSYLRSTAKRFATSHTIPYSSAYASLIRPELRDFEYKDRTAFEKAERGYGWFEIREYLAAMDEYLRITPNMNLDALIAKLDPIAALGLSTSGGHERIEVTHANLVPSDGQSVSVQTAATETVDGIHHIETIG